MKDRGPGVTGCLFSPARLLPVHRFHGLGAEHLAGGARALPRSLAEALQRPVSSSASAFEGRGGFVCLFWGFIYLFLERGEGGEKEGEKHHYSVASRVYSGGG